MYLDTCTVLKSERSERIARYRSLTSFCFAVNGRVQEAKVDGMSFCKFFLT